MKTYLINLDRSPERLEHMRDVMGAMGLDFIRLNAVDGRLLPLEKLQNSSALSPGEVGCLLSHRLAWQIIANSNDEFAVVLEDDIHLSHEAPLFLANHDWVPADADLVTFEAGRKPVALEMTGRKALAGRELARLTSTHSGAAGYIIRRSAAQKALEISRENNAPVDAILFDLPRGGERLTCIYQMNPALCIQDAFLPARERRHALASTLQEGRQQTRRSTKSFGTRLVREIAYPFRKAARLLRSSALRADGALKWTEVTYVDEALRN